MSRQSRCPQTKGGSTPGREVYKSAMVYDNSNRLCQLRRAAGHEAVVKRGRREMVADMKEQWPMGGTETSHHGNFSRGTWPLPGCQVMRPQSIAKGGGHRRVPNGRLHESIGAWPGLIRYSLVLGRAEGDVSGSRDGKSSPGGLRGGSYPAAQPGSRFR